MVVYLFAKDTNVQEQLNEHRFVQIPSAGLKAQMDCFTYLLS